MRIQALINSWLSSPLRERGETGPDLPFGCFEFCLRLNTYGNSGIISLLSFHSVSNASSQHSEDNLLATGSAGESCLMRRKWPKPLQCFAFADLPWQLQQELGRIAWGFFWQRSGVHRAARRPRQLMCVDVSIYICEFVYIKNTYILYISSFSWVVYLTAILQDPAGG